VVAKSVKDALAVPTAVIFKNPEGKPYVLVAGADKKAHQKIVQIGLRNAELTQVAQGIRAGDAIIVSGGYAVPDGTSIEIEKPAADEKEKPQPEKE
jgi:membrane fusion protein, multidrug efflux system